MTITVHTPAYGETVREGAACGVGNVPQYQWRGQWRRGAYTKTAALWVKEPQVVPLGLVFANQVNVEVRWVTPGFKAKTQIHHRDYRLPFQGHSKKLTNPPADWEGDAQVEYHRQKADGRGNVGGRRVRT